MAVSVQMPALGESVTEGTVTRWLKQEGDTVEVDEPLLGVHRQGRRRDPRRRPPIVLTKIVAQEDDTVEVGGELAVIGGASESRAAPASAPAEPAEAAPASSWPEPRARARPAGLRTRPEPAPAAPRQPADHDVGEDARTR